MTRDIDAASLRQELRDSVREVFLLDPTTPLDDDTSLLKEGILDSTGLLELVAYLEETYGFAILDEEILPENFDSVSHLCRYVRTRLSKNT